MSTDCCRGDANCGKILYLILATDIRLVAGVEPHQSLVIGSSLLSCHPNDLIWH